MRTVLPKSIFLGCLLIMGLSSPGYANDVQISLFAGDNLVDAAIGGRTSLAMADLIYGGGFTYRKDGDMKYSLGEAYLGVGNNFIPGWQFDAGFKGV